VGCFEFDFNEKWHEAIEFLNYDRLTLQNKTTAVNHKYGCNDTTLMMAALYGTPLTPIQHFCEIGGNHSSLLQMSMGPLPCTMLVTVTIPTLTL